MEPTSAVLVQRKLLRTLACPVTRGPIEVLPLVIAAGAIQHAMLYSPVLRAIVGQVRNYQIDFVRYPANVDIDAIRTRLADRSLPSEALEPRRQDLYRVDADLFRYDGDWQRLDDMMYSNGGVIATIRWHVTRPCRVLFSAHAWSGHAEVLVDGKVVHDIDLYEPHTTVPRSVVVDPTRTGMPSEVLVRTKGTYSPASMGRQCFFKGCEIESDATEPNRYAKKPGVRGGEFDWRFHDMLNAVPDAGLCLDMGGGNRQIDDQRYVNLDYAAYDEPDIIGDGLNLPFANDSFDFVYSSGVIEHLRDPLRSGRELYRVTKPGGRAMIGMAFMQPIHGEGQHFFNATVWGLEEAFKDFLIDEVFWDGSMSHVVDWIVRASEADRYADPKDLRQLQDILERLDAHVTYDRLKYISCGVWLIATKAARA